MTEESIEEKKKRLKDLKKIRIDMEIEDLEADIEKAETETVTESTD